MCEYLENCGDDFAIMVLPDHPTPISTGTHARDAVPFFAYNSKCEVEGDLYNEDTALKTGLHIDKGHSLMGEFLKLNLWK